MEQELKERNEPTSSATVKCMHELLARHNYDLKILQSCKDRNEVYLLGQMKEFLECTKNLNDMKEKIKDLEFLIAQHEGK